MGVHDIKRIQPVIPDPSIYKVEDVPDLKQTQERLAKLGLKDPWLRNEVWRYDKSFGTPWSRVRGVVFRGWHYGLALAIVAIGIEYAVKGKPEPHDTHSSH